jgi:twinkle protein
MGKNDRQQIYDPRKGLDESKPPGKLDSKGTGAISDLADNCFSIWRNKEKERLTQVKEEDTNLVSVFKLLLIM